MKKRLRKKLKLGEFKQVGLNITLNLIEGIENTDDFYNMFLKIIDENNFIFSGLFDDNIIDGYIYEAKYKLDTERNIKNIKNLLSKNPLVSNIKMGETNDAWN